MLSRPALSSIPLRRDILTEGVTNRASIYKS